MNFKEDKKVEIIEKLKELIQVIKDQERNLNTPKEYSPSSSSSLSKYFYKETLEVSFERTIIINKELMDLCAQMYNQEVIQCDKAHWITRFNKQLLSFDDDNT